VLGSHRDDFGVLSHQRSLASTLQHAAEKKKTLRLKPLGIQPFAVRIDANSLGMGKGFWCLEPLVYLLPNSMAPNA